MPQSQISRVLIAVVCILHAGCVTLPSMPAALTPHQAEPPHRIDVMWENHVYQAPDTVNGGTPLTGVAGRMYCFPSEAGPNKGIPMRVRGELTVDLYDAAPAAKGGSPTLLERWVIDPETLSRMARRDLLGWGYNLFLPWASHKPETRDIIMQVKFTPEKGTPLFTPQSAIHLLPPGNAPRVTHQNIRPVIRTPDPTPPQPVQVERLQWKR